MPEDPIVAEVRRHRRELAEELGPDMREACRRLRERQRESGREVVDLSKTRERAKR